jgi:uncharacterized membrane protein
MEIGGLPLHVLVVHGAVVLTPLAALVTIVFAVFPQWRWLSRWPAALSAAVALGSVLLAKFSGDSFLRSRPELGPLVEVHKQRGDWLMWATIVFFLVTALAVWTLSSTTPLPSGKGARHSRGTAADRVVPILVVLSAVTVLVLVVMTGDAGARAVWG